MLHVYSRQLLLTYPFLKCHTPFLQVFPGDLLSHTYPDPNNPDRLLGRSEFERRSEYISRLKMKLGGQEHRLFGVVRECLANNPERRPTTSDLLSSLEEVGSRDRGRSPPARHCQSEDCQVPQSKGSEDTGTAGEGVSSRQGV